MARIWIAQGKLYCVLNVGHRLQFSGIDERNAWVLVLGDLFPIVADQFGFDLNKLTPQTRFVEDLGAG